MTIKYNIYCTSDSHVSYCIKCIADSIGCRPYEKINAITFINI